MRFSIRKKIMLSFFLLVILLALAISVLFVQMSQSINRTRQFWEETELLSDVVSNLRNMDRALQKYLYAENDSSLEDYVIYSDQLSGNYAVLCSSELNNDSTLAVKNTRAVLAQFLNQYDTLTVAMLSEMSPAEQLQLETNLSYALDSAIYNSNRKTTKNMLDEVNHFEQMQTFTILFSLGICVFSVCLAFSLSRKLTKPVLELSESMRKLPENGFHGNRVTIRTSDELEEIGNTYNNMLDAMQAHVTQIQEMSEKLRASAELQSNTRLMQLRTLQAQINPHFLYNTLNAGAALAIRENADETGEFLVKLSKLFRYNLSELDSISTLREELQHVDLYFEILNTRYSKKIEYLKNVEECCYDVQMPRMILQPLVENSFLHGLAARKSGIIEITAVRDGDKAVLTIFDDGEGISPETLERINAGADSERKNQSSGFGLSNIIGRLRLFYSKENPIRFESEAGCYTRVVLTLPFSK